MTVHKPVLLKESIEALKLKPGDVVVDATLGGGGHSEAILGEIGSTGTLIAIDADGDAIKRFKAKSLKLKNKGRIFLINENFANLDNILSDLSPIKQNFAKAEGVKKVDAILADFGTSSDQLEKADRGFSFQKDASLDMRMDQREGMTSGDVVNTYPEKDLVRIFREYGDERYGRKIAKLIVEQRRVGPIRTTKELVAVIEKSVPEKYKHQRIHFATRVFQALRMEVNKELENIRSFIPKAIKVLDKSGRLAVITFHSGEDKISKEIFRENARGCICPADFPICKCGRKPVVRLVNAKPIIPSSEEISENPRSRSAKLRIVEKI